MAAERTIVSEAIFEAMVDGAVMRRLYQDAAYRNAAHAEEQAAREAVIVAEEVARLEAKYEVA